jgi:hypothetical protein
LVQNYPHQEKLKEKEKEQPFRFFFVSSFFRAFERSIRIIAQVLSGSALVCLFSGSAIFAKSLNYV